MRKMCSECFVPLVHAENSQPMDAVVCHIRAHHYRYARPYGDGYQASVDGSNWFDFYLLDYAGSDSDELDDILRVLSAAAMWCVKTPGAPPVDRKREQAAITDAKNAILAWRDRQSNADAKTITVTYSEKTHQFTAVTISGVPKLTITSKTKGSSDD